jgi:signal transduction histidine kinase
MVDSLLEFARLGGVADRKARAQVRETSVALLEELKPQAEEAHVELVLEEPVPKTETACSPAILSVLLSNLIRNSIKYMGSSRERRVNLRVLPCHRRALRFEVEDTGPGLEPELERMVFQAYARGARRGEPGLGLGLATVKRLVEAHGGKVGVSSKERRGSLFWFELPAA